MKRNSKLVGVIVSGVTISAIGMAICIYLVIVYFTTPVFSWANIPSLWLAPAVSFLIIGGLLLVLVGNRQKKTASFLEHTAQTQQK